VGIDGQSIHGRHADAFAVGEAEATPNRLLDEGAGISTADQSLDSERIETERTARNRGFDTVVFEDHASGAMTFDLFVCLYMN